MTSLDPLQRRSTSFSSNVRIKDLSKYGTFINKKTGVKSKVSEYTNKEAPLKDGDLLSFGTGNATYRFSYVLLIFFVQCSTANLVEDISSIGARATHSWSAECTHVLVDEYTPITEDLVDAIVAQKPVILKSWLKVSLSHTYFRVCFLFFASSRLVSQ
ncbi:Mre11 complex subunit Nbs1 [Ranunculus cassubicifolius]